MLIIEGKNGKSTVIQQMIDANKKGNLILDTVGVKALNVSEKSEHLILPKEMSIIDLEDLLNQLKLDNYIRVILLLNTSKDDMYNIRNLSYKFPEQKFIITVQSEIENIKTYEY